MAALPAKERTRGEVSSKEVFNRLAGTWTYWGWKGGYFDTEEDAQAFFDEHRLQEVLLDVTIGSSPDTALLEARPQDEPAYLFVCGASRYGDKLCGDGAEILIHQLVGSAGTDASLDQQHGEWRLQGRFAVQPDGGVHQGIMSINLRPVMAK